MSAAILAAAAAASKASKVAARLLKRDAVIHAFTPQVRLALVNCTASAEDGRRRFNVTNRAAASLYGKTIAGAALMAAMLKGEERAILQFMCVTRTSLTTYSRGGRCQSNSWRGR
jgi:hypothetical protein